MISRVLSVEYAGVLILSMLNPPYVIFSLYPWNLQNKAFPLPACERNHYILKEGLDILIKPAIHRACYYCIAEWLGSALSRSTLIGSLSS